MAGMTKADRAEFETRRNALDHYARIALDQCLAYGLESKSAWLAAQRAKDEAQRLLAMVDSVLETVTEETAKEETAPRRAFVFVRDYGDTTQCRDLCDLINAKTLYHAYLNDNGTPVIPCRIHELGDFLSRMAENPQTSWIEFSVNFEF